MVARKDHSVGLLYGNPTGGLKGLCGFVNEQRVVVLPAEQRMGRACQGRCYHAGIVKERMANAQFQFVGSFAQSRHLLMEIVAATLARCAVELADVAAYGPERGIVGMGRKAVLVGMGKHGRCDARRIANAQNTDTAVGQLARNPVHRRIALGANHHLRLAAKHFADGFNEGGRLARARRAMYHHYIARPQHFAHRLLLCRIEPGQGNGHGRGRTALRTQSAVANIAQMGQPSFARRHHSIERLKHQPIRGFVESQADAQTLNAVQLGEHALVGQYDDHALVLGIRHRGAPGQQPHHPLLLREEANGFAVLEVVLYIQVFGAKHFDHEAVQSVVVTPPKPHGPPTIAALHAATNARSLESLSKLRALGFVLHAKQVFLFF